MAEHEAARCLGRPDDVAIKEVVERVQSFVVADARGCCRQVWLERLARHGGAVEEATGARSERLELFGDRARERGRKRRPSVRAAELLEVERISAGLAVDRGRR